MSGSATPPERVFTVPVDQRTAPIATDNRTYQVPNNE